MREPSCWRTWEKKTSALCFPMENGKRWSMSHRYWANWPWLLIKFYLSKIKIYICSLLRVGLKRTHRNTLSRYEGTIFQMCGANRLPVFAFFRTDLLLAQNTLLSLSLTLNAPGDRESPLLHYQTHETETRRPGSDSPWPCLSARWPCPWRWCCRDTPWRPRTGTLRGRHSRTGSGTRYWSAEKREWCNLWSDI